MSSMPKRLSQLTSGMHGLEASQVNALAVSVTQAPATQTYGRHKSVVVHTKSVSTHTPATQVDTLQGSEGVHSVSTVHSGVGGGGDGTTGGGGEGEVGVARGGGGRGDYCRVRSALAWKLLFLFVTS